MKLKKRIENVQKLKQNREYSVVVENRLESVAHVVKKSKINPWRSKLKIEAETGNTLKILKF